MPKKKSYKIPLIIAAILLVIIAAALYLLIAPIAIIPSWFIPAREAFYASAFYSDFENNFITDARYMYIVKGLGVTFEVTFFAGFGKGVLYFFYKLCGVYLTVIRGTPVVVQLMIIYFVIFASSNNKILVAVLAFGINSGAYVAEIIRGGIMSIDKGQFEAGRSLGFGYVRTMQTNSSSSSKRLQYPVMSDSRSSQRAETSSDQEPIPRSCRLLLLRSSILLS